MRFSCCFRDSEDFSGVMEQGRGGERSFFYSAKSNSDEGCAALCLLGFEGCAAWDVFSGCPEGIDLDSMSLCFFECCAAAVRHG